MPGNPSFVCRSNIYVAEHSIDLANQTVAVTFVVHGSVSVVNSSSVLITSEFEVTGDFDVGEGSSVSISTTAGVIQGE